MDKSMIPILVALVAIVAAGAALALHGGGTEDGKEPPSGYPPGLDDPENERMDPINPENWQVGPVDDTDPTPIIKIESRLTAYEGDDVVINGSVYQANQIIELSYSSDTVKISNCSLLSLGTSDEKSITITLQELKGVGDLTVTVKVGHSSASCVITVKEPGAPADVPSVSGGSPAMEFYLELAPGGSKAIDVPSEYLSLLSMAQWSSSDPSVCTVTADPVAGKVTAVAHKAGECDLTASLGFYSAVCHVTVERSQ